MVSPAAAIRYTPGMAFDDAPPPSAWRSRLLSCLIGCFGVLFLTACLFGGLLLYGLLEALGETAEVTPDVAPLLPVTASAPATALAAVSPTPRPTRTPTRPAATPTSAPVPSLAPTAARPLFNAPRNLEQTLPAAAAWETLAQLWSADFPAYDYLEIARRFGDASTPARTVIGPPRAVGDRLTITLPEQEFDVILAAVTENTYFWMEDGLRYNAQELERVTRRLEVELYPRLTELFGQEWRPGIDDDPRFSLVHFRGDADMTELGFFDSTNQYPRAFDELSNEQEMVFLNMAELELGDELYYGTLVHELQHLMQWNADANESVWLDEGLGQLAELALGFQTADAEEYLAAPSTPLEAWDYGDAVYAHYGAAYLFLSYFWERLGDAAVYALAHEPANGLAAVQRVLQTFGPDLSVEQLAADWAVANLLDDQTRDPRYGYRTLRLGRPELTARVRALPYADSAELGQFGVHYIDLRTPGNYTLSFAGDTLVELLPAQSPDGQPIWMAPGLDDANPRLTRRLDLTALSRARLAFALWYDLEEDYDFALVSVSADDGRTWQALRGKNTVSTPYGPGFTGFSSDRRGHRNGWLQEEIDLGRFLGRSVWVRIELVGDAAVVGAGLALSDLRVIGLDEQPASPETAEWLAEGFLYGDPQLPQRWSVQLVQETAVETIALDAYNQARLPVTIGPRGATLVIMPQTPVITTPVRYWVQVGP